MGSVAPPVYLFWQFFRRYEFIRHAQGVPNQVPVNRREYSVLQEIQFVRTPKIQFDIAKIRDAKPWTIMVEWTCCINREACRLRHAFPIGLDGSLSVECLLCHDLV